jgi:hypothetical protein
MENTTIVLSIPFARVGRLLLNPGFLGTIDDQGYSLIVVSPFYNNPSFRKMFSARVTHLPPPIYPPFNSVKGKIGALAEKLRTYGYFAANRQNGLAYYYETIGLIPGFDLHGDTYGNLFLRFLNLILAHVGRHAWIWRALEKLAFPGDPYPMLTKTLNGYPSEIIILQMASWGEQDRLIGSYSRHFKCKSMFIPYTTDQLWVNGFLLDNYDVVFTQGPFEHQCLRTLHRWSAPMVELGSFWFRLLKRTSASKSSPSTILYAGVSGEYFPKESEFLAIEHLHYLVNASGTSCRLVYRPFVTGHKEQQLIDRFLESRNWLEVQHPQSMNTGLDSFDAENSERQLEEYVEQLSNVKLLVMSHTTSLGLDAAVLGSCVICNFWDPSGTMTERKSELRFDASGQLAWAPGFPIARTKEELTHHVSEFLNNPTAEKSMQETALAMWDYPDISPSDRFRQQLKRLVRKAPDYP